MADTLTKIIISAVDQTASGLDSVIKNLSGVQSMAATLGVTLSAVGMMTLVKQSIDAADNLSKLAQKTGTAVETLAGLKFAADQNGTSLETVALAAKKLSTAMVDKPELFAKLGITAKDSTGALVQMADLFAAMPDGVNKTALAVQLMGKNGEEMIPFLNQGTIALRDMIEQGKLFNPVTAESAKQAELFNDQLDALKAQAGGLGVTIANDMLPGLTQITSAMAQAAKESGLLMAGIVGIGGAMKAVFTDDLMGREDKIIRDMSAAKSMVDSSLPEYIKVQHREKLATLQQELNGLNKVKDEEKARLENLKEFRTTMSALRVDAAQAGVYEKALGGASDAEIAKMQANVDNFKRLAAAHAPQAAKTVDAYAGIQKASANYIKSLEKEIAQSGLDVIQKKMVEASLVALTLKTEKERMAVMQSALAWADATRAADDAKSAQEALTKAAEDEIKAKHEAIKSNQEYMSGIGKITEDLIEKAKASEDEIALIGKSVEQITAITAARYDEQIALKMAEAERLRGIDGREAELFLIRRQIEALGNLKNAEVVRPALQAQADAWKKYVDGIDRALTDALMRGFENGKNFGENFIDSLKNTLKTAALKIAVRAIVDPVMGGIQSVSQGGSFSSGMGNMPFPGSGMLGNGISMLGGATGSLGMSGFGTGMALGAEGSAAAISAYTSAAATAATAAEAASMTAAASSLSAGASLAAAGPYVAAAVVAAQALGLFDSGNPAVGTGYSARGEIGRGGITGDMFSLASDGSSNFADPTPAGTISRGDLSGGAIRAFADLRQSAADIARNLGVTADIAKDISVPYNVSVGMRPGAVDAAITQAMVAGFPKAILTALQTSDLPDYLRNYFSQLQADTMSSDSINAALQYAVSIKQVRDGLLETRAPLEIAQAQVASLAREFHTSATAFKTDFVAAIDAGLTPATLARWQQLGQAIEQASAAQERAADEHLRAAQSSYDAAKSGLLDAYNRESDAAQRLADSMRGFSASFSALRNSLNLGALSTLSPEAKYFEARRQFDDVARRAQLGDTAAMAQMEGVSQSFLQASKDYNASSAAYAADFARVGDALEASGGVASRQADISAQQVTLLRGQLDALGLINASVLSVADALAAYRAATGALSTSAAAAGNVAINEANPSGGSSLADLYRINLGRAPDAAGLAYWSERFGSGIDAAEAQQFALAAMPEYLSKHSLPGYADGSNVIPFDHVAMVHKGEEIKPAAYVDRDRAERAETNALLREVIAELRADKVQRGSATAATLNKLEVVADKLDGNKRELARAA